MVFLTTIPTRRNDGSRVSQAELAGITKSLYDRFGGCTVQPGVTGHWIEAGRHYQDDNLLVTVACDSDRLAEAETVVRQIGRQLEQKAMWFEVRYFDGPRILRIE
jgi:hypothetical protein